MEPNPRDVCHTERQRFYASDPVPIPECKHPVRVEGKTAILTLRQGHTVLVDVDDLVYVAPFTWDAYKAANTHYARTTYTRDGKTFRISMHQLLLLGMTGDKEHIDHKDGNGLNNKRSNIRPATPWENAQNKGVCHTSKTGFKGVTQKGRKFIAFLSLGKHKKLPIGEFKTAKEAAQAYDQAARRYLGPFAKLNCDMGLVPEVKEPPRRRKYTVEGDYDEPREYWLDQHLKDIGLDETCPIY